VRRLRFSRHALVVAAGMGAALLVREVRERRSNGAKAAPRQSRKFELKKGEPLPEGILRIAEGRLDHALDELSGRAGSDQVKAVHEARKDLKKLRALTRLAAADPRWNRRFRDSARRLSGRRDTDVLIQTLDGMVERGEIDRTQVKELRKRLVEKARRTEGDDHAAELAHDELLIARGELAELAPSRGSFDHAVRPGLERIYRQGRRRYRGARKRPDTESLHEWRKRVKDLWYSASVLNPAWPGMMSELAAQARELSELLGDDHDLAMLDAVAGKRLRKAIRRRRRKLRKRALRMGRRLYAEKPASFAGRIAEAWAARV
jgi:CHAD domain-containing protein